MIVWRSTTHDFKTQAFNVLRFWHRFCEYLRSVLERPEVLLERLPVSFLMSLSTLTGGRSCQIRFRLSPWACFVWHVAPSKSYFWYIRRSSQRLFGRRVLLSHANNALWSFVLSSYESICPVIACSPAPTTQAEFCVTGHPLMTNNGAWTTLPDVVSDDPSITNHAACFTFRYVCMYVCMYVCVYVM